jgi:hypothetical protein
VPGEQLGRLDPAALDEALHILKSLSVEPYADGRRKHIVTLGDETQIIYDGDLVWMTYHFIDNEVVSVLTCAAWRGRRPPPIL